MPLNVVLKQAGAYRVSGVSCGGGHSGLVYSDGSVYTFGRLGLGRVRVRVRVGVRLGLGR